MARQLRQSCWATRTVAGFLVCALAVVPALTHAHAIVLSARPAMNSNVAQGPLELRLDFNSRIDAQRSRLLLRGPDGTPTTVALADSPPNSLIGHATVTAVGPWKLDWQVLSLDGHITRGEIRFSVGAASSKP